MTHRPPMLVRAAALALASAAALLLQACATPAVRDEISFTGELFNAGAMMPVTTVLWKDARGQPAGRYVFREPGDPAVKGTLGPCESRSNGALRCVWKDKYGSGYFYATFSADHRGFDGRWGGGDLNHSLTVDGVWNGRR